MIYSRYDLAEAPCGKAIAVLFVRVALWRRRGDGVAVGRDGKRRNLHGGGRVEAEQEIKACYCQMYRGMIGKDRQALLDVLDDAVVLIHMTGMRQDKDAFIRAVEDGTLNYYSADHQRIEAKAHGDEAELIGQSVVSAAVFGGGAHTWRLQLKMKLVLKGGRWQIAQARASTY